MDRSASVGSAGAPSPTLPAVLVASAAACGAIAWSVVAGHRLLGGVFAIIPAVSVFALPVVAGPARARQARFAGLMEQRVYEAAVLGSLAWVERLVSVRVAVLALVCLGTSYVASYERARGMSLGYRQGESLGYRATTAGVLVLALLSGWVEPLLWAFAVVTAAAGVARAGSVAGQERRHPRRGTFSS